MGVCGQRHAPAALPPVKSRHLLYRRLGGPQGRSERVRKNSLSPGFDPCTVQPVASRHTDWAIPAHVDKQEFFSIPVQAWTALRVPGAWGSQKF
jgi:hypothetical protein